MPEPMTTLLTPVWVGLNEAADREQAADFFAIFARFEYALKATKFAQARRGYVEPDWEKFLSEVESYTAPDSVQLSEAVSYLIENPPKGQILHDGRTTYELIAKKPTGRTGLAKAVRSAKRVRNNLFHGGKYMGHSESSARNRRLLEASVIVLSAAILAVDGLLDEYKYS